MRARTRPALERRHTPARCEQSLVYKPDWDLGRDRVFYPEKVAPRRKARGAGGRAGGGGEVARGGTRHCVNMLTLRCLAVGRMLHLSQKWRQRQAKTPDIARGRGIMPGQGEYVQRAHATFSGGVFECHASRFHLSATAFGSFAKASAVSSSAVPTSLIWVLDGNTSGCKASGKC